MTKVGRDRLLRFRKSDIAFVMLNMGQLLSQDAGSEPPGGAETQILFLSRELASRGLRVALIIRPVRGATSPLPGIRLMALPRWSLGRDRRLVGKALELLGLTYCVLKARPRVLVQRMGSYVTGLSAFAAQAGRCRLVWSSANIFDFSPEQSGMRPRDSRIFRYGVRRADAIVVQSVEQQDLCLRRFARSSFLVPSLAEVGRAGTERRSGAIWIGRAVPYKKPFDLITLARKCPDTEFKMIVVANSPDEAELRLELARAAQECGNVTLLAPMRRDKLRRVIAGSDVLISTSSHEGMPNVFLEAWAQGVPTLVVGHDPDGIVAKNGLGIAANGDLGVAADVLDSISDDRDSWLVTGNRCREWVAREHSPAVVGDLWVRIFEEIW